MADDLWQRSAVELADGIRQKAFSCREVMESVGGRIRAMNPTLNAIVYDYTDDALAEARRADDELAAGRARGPLHGVPVTIKENVDHHGNDIGGSLRFPAFACGVATVKPTPGRIAAFNPSATAERGMLAQLMSVQGAICREVRDVRLATRIMAQHDARDPWWVPAPFDGEPVPGPIRVAFTKNAHGYPMHPEIGRAIERVAGWLAAAGYAVDEV